MPMYGIASQMLASMYTLKDCIDRCPEKEWNEKHNDYPFSQVVFHTLFDCDLNMCSTIEEIKMQDFHILNKKIFDDYEELEEKERRHTYPKHFIEQYYTFCILKIEKVIGNKKADELMIPNMDIYRSMSIIERYINAIRHIQHHAAQLGLRLQNITGEEMQWIGRAYKE